MAKILFPEFLPSSNFAKHMKDNFEQIKAEVKRIYTQGVCSRHDCRDRSGKTFGAG
ncbi:MAG: hypothetical protein WC615_01785 [Mucilaginibacter sp.]|jgi:hypothetical protein